LVDKAAVIEFVDQSAVDQLFNFDLAAFGSSNAINPLMFRIPSKLGIGFRRTGGDRALYFH